MLKRTKLCIRRASNKCLVYSFDLKFSFIPAAFPTLSKRCDAGQGEPLDPSSRFATIHQHDQPTNDQPANQKVWTLGCCSYIARDQHARKWPIMQQPTLIMTIRLAVQLADISLPQFAILDFHCIAHTR